MKNLVARFAAVFLTLMLILSTTPLNTYALDDTVKTATESYSNPMYNGVAIQSYTPAPRVLSSATGYSSLEEAGEYLKKQMILRSGTIRLTINKPYNSTLAGEIFNEAIKDNGTPDPDGGDYLYAHFDGYNASISYTSTSTTITYNMRYLSTYAQEKEVDAEVDRVLNSLNLSSKDTYSKIKAVHDYIVKNIDYDYDYANYSGYNAIVEKKAVCQGFTSITCKMLEELGIGTRYIVGNDSTHAWNIIKIGSYWYNSDNTWDENLTTSSNICYDYFLKGSSDFKDHTRDAKYNTSTFNSSYPVPYSKYVYSATPVKKSISGAQITVSNQTYTGSALTPAITVKLDGSTLSKGTDYTVSYSNNVNVGTATVTITGIGNYTGTKSANFSITAPVEDVIATGVTTGNLNVRSGPSTAYTAIGKLATGDKIQIVAKDSSTGWFKIKYNSGYGYVSYKYVTDVVYLNQNNNNNDNSNSDSDSEVIATGVTTGSLNVRSGPSTAYTAIGKLSTGDKVQIVAKDSSTGWFKIKYNSGYGYVSYKYVTDVVYLNQNNNNDNSSSDSEVIATGVTTGNLNVRSGPSTAYTAIGKLSTGDTIQIVDQDSATSWFKIKYNGGYGYVSYKYVTNVVYKSKSTRTVEDTTTGITNNSVNVRSGPSSSYTLLGKLSAGTTVQIVTKSGNWYKIKYNSGYGYIYYKYVNL